MDVPPIPGTPASRLSSAAIASTVIVAGGMVQGQGSTFWANAFLLILFFLLPAQSIRTPADVARAWRPLLAIAFAGTACWDVMTAVLAGARPFLSEWYLVYASGPLVLMLLFLCHAALATALARFLHADGPESR